MSAPVISLEGASVLVEEGVRRAVAAVQVTDVPGLMIHAHPNWHGMWLVSHIASGRCLPPQFHSMKRCVDFIRAAARYADWTAPAEVLQTDRALERWLRQYQSRTLYKTARAREGRAA